MLRITRLLGTLTITAIALPAHAQAPAAQQGVLRVPVADRKPHETRIHGYTLTDNYFWLREKSDPAGARLSRGRERVHGSGDEAHRAFAASALRRDAASDQADRSDGVISRRRIHVLLADRGGAAISG
jgi:hypothetical protein